jgi:chaperonin cofactor prefoldin
MPHDDDNSAVSILKEQIGNLTAQLQTLTSERDEYRDALSEVSDQRDKLKAQVQDPGDVAKENAALKQKIRDRTAYDKFAELAEKAGAKKGATKHLWKLAEYQADKDEPDEHKLAELLDGLKAEADYAFEPAGTDSAAARAPEISKTRSGLELKSTPAPAGGGRSARNQGGDGTIVTAEMRADPKFMLDPKNRELITAAAKEGRFR